MDPIAIVSDKGQVTVPKSVRDSLGIQPGSRLEFRLSSGGTLQVSVLPTGARSLSGLLARPGEPARTLQEMDRAVTEAVVERSRRSR